MKIKTARKLGFWTAVAILFGTIVGIGVFFKNGSISGATGGNGVATLLAWIIGGLISLFAALSFSEIGSQKFKNVQGLAAWSEKALGKKFGYFTRFNLSFFYYGIMTVIFGIFVSESLIQVINACNDSKQIPVYAHVIVGIGIDAFFIVINHLSAYHASWISRFSTVLKLIPLVTVAVAGLALAATNNAPDTNNLTGVGHNAFTNGASFSFTGLLAALPAVLFAYDAFLEVGTYSEKVEGGSKTVSKAIVFTIISVLVLYSFISIAHILHGAGNVLELFKQVLPAKAQKAIAIFVWIFIFISACGVLNGMTISAVSSIEQVTRTSTIFGSKKLIAKFGLTNTTYIYQAFIFVFWCLVIFIPAMVLKSDSIVDSFSNFPTLFFFGIYGLTIFGYWRKRKTTQSEKINAQLWYIASALALVGIGFIVAYQIFYGFTIRAFIHPDGISSAGLFVATQKLALIQEFGIFLGALVAFAAIPALNVYLAKRFEKHNPIVDTESLKLDLDQ